MVKKILAIKGKVESVELGKVPKIYLYKIVSSDKETIVNLELHENLKVVEEGDMVSLEIFEGKPRRISEKDFVGKGYLFKIESENSRSKYIFSIGGFIMTLVSNKSINGLKNDKEYYIRLQKT